jgi:hypothetical protein
MDGGLITQKEHISKSTVASVMKLYPFPMNVMFNKEDRDYAVTAAKETYDKWNLIKSTTSIKEVRAYQDDIDDSRVSVDGWINHVDQRMNDLKTEMSQAKIYKKQLDARENQAKRLAISIYRYEKDNER